MNIIKIDVVNKLRSFPQKVSYYRLVEEAMPLRLSAKKLCREKICLHDVISVGSSACRSSIVQWPTDFCIGGIPKGENYVICPFANFAAPAMGWKVVRLFESFLTPYHSYPLAKGSEKLDWSYKSYSWWVFNCRWGHMNPFSSAYWKFWQTMLASHDGW